MPYGKGGATKLRGMKMTNTKMDHQKGMDAMDHPKGKGKNKTELGGKTSGSIEKHSSQWF